MAPIDHQTPNTIGLAPSSIELEIEELILHGFPPAERHRIGEAIEHELARLLTEHGIPPAWAAEIEHEALDGGGFQVSLDDRPDQVGAQVAQFVYESF